MTASNPQQTADSVDDVADSGRRSLNNIDYVKLPVSQRHPGRRAVRQRRVAGLRWAVVLPRGPARRGQDVVLIKTLLYTGVRVSELVSIRLTDVDLDSCRIRIEHRKGKQDRYVPFTASFKETLALHIGAQKQAGASHLFESSWKKPYSDRGVRKILARYASAAGIEGPISPHRLRHFLFTWLKTQGIDDALIQPYSGHATRQSLEIYSRIALANAQDAYDQAIGRYPV